METPIHSLASLFDQLGLDSTELAIEDFIKKHKRLPGYIDLYKAGFWSAPQASFLKQAKDEDADWATVVDQLNALLHKRY